MTQQFTTTKGSFLIVKVPEDSHNYQTWAYSMLSYELKEKWSEIILPEGNWQIVGNPFGFSEDQCNDIVDIVWNGHNEQVFKDYLDDDWCPSAKSSMDRLLFNLNIHNTNPYGEEPKDIPDLGAFTQSQRKKWIEWKALEERTGSFILLKKI